MNYKVCTRTVMDTTTKLIQFDEQGVCNYCHEFDRLAADTIWRPEEVKRKELESIVKRIKKKGNNQKYDCILGLSGGVDSTYLALLAKRHGLRPLCVHFDNGWNTETAVQNINNIVKILGFDLHTFVMDWEEFRDIQIAYFKAGVLDLEVPTDQFIFAALYRIARKNNIHFILSGNNIATEFVLPRDWFYNKFDLVNLENIHKKFGTAKLDKLPKLGRYQRHYYDVMLRIERVNFLNLVHYNKLQVKEEIKTELKWKDYGGKHYESIFTRWYQGYYLLKKFNIDKRKAHLSNLILNREITREQALAELDNPTYDVMLQKEDNEYVAKKWGMSKEEFEAVMNSQPVDHHVYGTETDSRENFKFNLFRAFVFLPTRIGRLLGVYPKVNPI